MEIVNKQEWKEEFSRRLKKAMSDKKMNATELSDMTGIGKSDLSNYINGKYMPKQDRIYILAKALDVKPSWLYALDTQLANLDMFDGLSPFSVPISLTILEKGNGDGNSEEVVSTESWDADAAFSEEDASNIRILARGMMNISPENRKQLLDVARALFKNDFDDEGNKR